MYNFLDMKKCFALYYHHLLFRRADITRISRTFYQSFGHENSLNEQKFFEKSERINVGQQGGAGQTGEGVSDYHYPNRKRTPVSDGD